MAECSSPESLELRLEIAALESRDRRLFGNKNSFSCQSNFAFATLPRAATGIPRNSHNNNNNVFIKNSLPKQTCNNLHDNKMNKGKQLLVTIKKHLLIETD